MKKRFIIGGFIWFVMARYSDQAIAATDYITMILRFRKRNSMLVVKWIQFGFIVRNTKRVQNIISLIENRTCKI